MKTPSLRMLAAVPIVLATLAACGTARGAPAPVQPGTPPAAEAAGGVQPRHTEADVRFMQGMIAHHQQALEMTGLVPARTSRQDLRLLAERMEVSQRDEIAQMRRWLESRGEEVPAAHHGHHGHHAAMPGMLTPQETARLAAATGPEFERLFLELMIRHHEGAIQMVAALFGSPGAG